MRILKPEVAKEREETILRWVVEQFASTRRPVGSALVAQEALPGVSSATIRNIMAKLEEEGFLHQMHASGGRIPTDKAYRFYVDYLTKAQRMAAAERARIEKEYEQKIAEADKAMVQTSRMLAMLSHSAGFVFTADVGEKTIQRLDFIPLSPSNLLVVLVTEDGVVKHWPVRSNHIINTANLRIMGHFLNEQIRGLSLKDAQRVLWEVINRGHKELGGMADLALKVLKDMSAQTERANELYLDGVGALLETMGAEDYDDLRRMIKVMEEKERLSSMLAERMQDLTDQKRISVSIGAENELSEMRNLSVVSSAYKVGEKTVGMVGIIGPKHMEYTRMISLVNFMGGLLENAIENWKDDNDD